MDSKNALDHQGGVSFTGTVNVPADTYIAKLGFRRAAKTNMNE